MGPKSSDPLSNECTLLLLRIKSFGLFYDFGVVLDCKRDSRWGAIIPLFVWSNHHSLRRLKGKIAKQSKETDSHYHFLLFGETSHIYFM